MAEDDDSHEAVEDIPVLEMEDTPVEDIPVEEVGLAEPAAEAEAAKPPEAEAAKPPVSPELPPVTRKLFVGS